MNFIKRYFERKRLNKILVVYYNEIDRINKFKDNNFGDPTVNFMITRLRKQVLTTKVKLKCLK